jgi:hypothetical protein
MGAPQKQFFLADANVPQSPAHWQGVAEAFLGGFWRMAMQPVNSGLFGAQPCGKANELGWLVVRVPPEKIAAARGGVSADTGHSGRSHDALTISVAKIGAGGSR